MSSLINEKSKFHLDADRLSRVLEEITNRLQGRVNSAYLFGSAATGEISADSDIDLILVIEKPSLPFVERALEFKDLYEVYPKLDILVYTKQELEQQLADSSVGFWKSVRLSMKQFI